MEDLRIDPEFQNKIPPIGEDEFKQLRENILEAGEVYEPIVLWNGVIVDGHNRWKIIKENPGIKWRTRTMEFADKWAAFDWMYKNQLGRRNLTDEQRTYTIGKMYEARVRTRGGQENNNNASKRNGQNGPIVNGKTRNSIAEELGIGSRTVDRAGAFAKGVDALREVSPEAADKVLTGKTHMTKTEVGEIAHMSSEDIKSKADEITGNVRRSRPVGRTKEMRELRAVIDESYKPMLDHKSESTFDIHDLVEEITVNGEDCAAKLRRMVEIHNDIIRGSVDALVAVQNAFDAVVRMIIKEEPIYEEQR